MRYKITTLKYKAGWKCDPVGLYLYYLQQSAGQGFATRNTGERKTFAQLTKWNGRQASAVHCSVDYYIY